MSIIDALQGSDQYALDVAVVDLSDKDEKEQNIFFNNQSAMGTWDTDLLTQLIKDDGVDYTAAGFDDMDLQLILDDPDFSPHFASEEAPEAVKQDVASLEEIQKMKRARKEYREAAREEDDAEYVAIVVFPNREAQGRFMERCGSTKDDKYVDGLKLHTLLEVAAERKPARNGFVDMKFAVSMEQEKVIEGEITRIGSLLQGKNIRGRALEFMAVNSGQTPYDNLVGEEVPEDKDEDLTELIKKKKKKAKSAGVSKLNVSLGKKKV